VPCGSVEVFDGETAATLSVAEWVDELEEGLASDGEVLATAFSFVFVFGVLPMA
jgi:hypothetical protein